MVVRISGSAGISFNNEPFATEPFVTSALEDIPVFQKKIARFTGDGTWTVPAGVTYAIAYIRGGGGGGGGRTGGAATQGNVGGVSSVDFASGLVSAAGGYGGPGNGFSGATDPGDNAAANSGKGGQNASVPGGRGGAVAGNSGMEIVHGAAVTPAAVIDITVGAGGTGTGANAKGGDGGSGYVYIEYYEEI